MTKFQVRTSVGLMLGTIKVLDVRNMVNNRSLRLARAVDPRYHGYGLRELPPMNHDISFNTMDLKLSTWMEPPQLTKEGNYEPGRCDWVLIWDGPWAALDGLSGFEWTR